MQESSRTLGYVCPECMQPVIARRSVFSLCVSDSELPCPCGKSRLAISPMDADITLTVPCAGCKKTHMVTVPHRAFLYQRALALSCPGNGLDCCYVGEEGPVFDAMRRLESALDRIHPIREENQPEEEAEQFLNQTVMQESLEELRDIAARNGISCTCGSKKWSLRIHYASIEVSCGVCGGKLRVPAATQEDLTDLCCKNTLLIKER